MAEYIDREAAKDELLSWAVCINHSEHLMREDAIYVLDAIPAADVAPVRHGKWENGNPICPVCGGNKFRDLDADIWCDWQPYYCPNCGAKMNVGDGNSDICSKTI